MPLNHKDSCLNCLTDEQFNKLCTEHEEGDEFSVDCSECSTYFLGDHRCNCGNRRVAVYFQDNENPEYRYFYAEAY